MKAKSPAKPKKAKASADPLAAPELPLAEEPTTAAPAPANEIVPGALDESFARLMTRLNGTAAPGLEHAARTVSAWRGAGHSCVPIQKLGSDPAALTASLRATRVVGAPGEWKPLILDEDGRLYLQRYWNYEQEVASAILSRLAAEPPAIDRERLERGLEKLFGPPPNDQRAAAETALTSTFCVITGGPGTGKTRTVARILALLQEQCAGAADPLRIALAAPTGKAAARMTESIQLAMASLQSPDSGSAPLPSDAVTLHRLLGITPESPLPRFHAKNPMPVDVIIVDEASMIDLAMMAKLFGATPPGARLILLGDKDQLASVEAGHVLGDICDAPATENPTRLHRAIAHLRQSFRFAAGSGIQRLAKAVNDGDPDAVIALLASGESDEIAGATLPQPEKLGAALRGGAVEGYRKALTAEDPQEALAEFGRFRILCATRSGPCGVENLNHLMEQALAEARLIAPASLHYHGRPVMIVRNDYTLRLFNGDIGLILRDPETRDLRAFFPGADGGVRRILPSRLPPHETVWAMTVHKSQGSEFDRVLQVLPDRDTPVLTRELVYTGITRAKQFVETWFRPAVLRTAIARRTERVSGLRDALWNGAAA